MTTLQTKRVAVLRGGPSEEHAVSLLSGAETIRALQEKGFNPVDIIVSKQKDWLQHGKVKTPQQILDQVDVVFIALHGAYGEDGEVQRLLQKFKVPFVGSYATPSAIAMNKFSTKEMLRTTEIPLAKHVFIPHGISAADVSSIIVDTRLPVIVKPVHGGSSLGVALCTTLSDVNQAIQDVFLEYDDDALVEEFLVGREATVAVLENFRGEDLYTFPAIEIVPHRERSFFDYDAKYNGLSNEICPGNFSEDERSLLAYYAKLAHTTLGLTQLSRVDFIIQNGKPHFLEVNTIPGMTKESLLPKAARSVGLPFCDLIEHLVLEARA